MPHTELDPGLHAACLEGGANAATAEQRAGHMAVFLVLRVVDLFAEATGDDAISYQIGATRTQLSEMGRRSWSVGVETVLDAAQEALESGATTDLTDTLLALSAELQGSLELDASADVLDTALRLPLNHADRARALVEKGRTLRLRGDLSDSLDAYQSAIDLAQGIGDRVAEFRGRSGFAQTLVRTGNLPKAEEILRSVIGESHAIGHRRVEAGARHNLAMVHSAREEYQHAVVELYGSYHLHDDPRRKLRVLSDLGMTFKDLGSLQASRDCFEIFLAGDITTEMRLNACLELIELSARMLDRAAFDRLMVQTDKHPMPPDARVDYHIKVGAGLAIFGNRHDATRHLQEAIARAEAHGLNTYLFEAETALARLNSDASPRTEVLPDGQLRSEIRAVVNNLRRERNALAT